MRKIVFVFFILFFVFPVFAGENVERQAEKQIIVARDYACEDSCKMDLDSCNRGCRLLSGDLIVKSCRDNCIEDYGHCMQKCN